MHRSTVLAAAIALVLAGCSGQKAEAPSTPAPEAAAPVTATETANPLLVASTLPFEAPPFDKIKDTDYEPAIEEGMKQHLAEVQAIADSAEPPTFANTVEAFERTGALLTRAGTIFSSLTSANTNETLQKADEALSPKLAAHSDEIYLNPKLFARFKAVYDARDSAGLDAEQKRLVEEYQDRFVRAGALLNDADKATLREINKEESTLSTAFTNKLLAATNAAAVVVDDRARLDGYDDSDLAAAAEAAKSRGQEGKWVISLQNTTQQPALVSLKDRGLREQLLRASMERAEHGDANDTLSTIERQAELRAQRAKLLGFPNYAAYSLADQMAKTPEAAIKLLTDTVPAATAKARGEVAKMQQLIDAQKGGFKLAAWDWDFYAEQVRKAEFDLDEAAIKPYFELDRVLQDGVFFAANQLYGITFKERKDIPVYHPDVRVFDVFDADGTQLALFYADFFKRDAKRGGAWMGNFVEQNGLTGTIPVIYNVCNYTKPAPGQPALLSFDEVTTTFHEFGHALHGIFSKTKYPSLAGTSVSRDFVEFPSQFNEHWANDPAVFANYAKHYQTGEPMPEDLVQKIRKARTFNQGYATTEYLAAALLDQAWHSLPADAGKQDAKRFEAEALERYRVNLPEVPPRYRSPYFAHIWGGGYSAGYYAYFWAEVLDHDAFQWFRENGGLTRQNGQTFRDKILSRGNTVELATLYRDFRGKDPSVEPLLEHRGLK